MTMAKMRSAKITSKGPHLGDPIPAEGENGFFSQSWFPICRSYDIRPGEVKGFDFLDGRVIVFRGENGVASVKSAYCPHVGADLSVGKVVGNNIRCAFHHWDYDQSGKCVKTGIGDPPPPTACLFNFPTLERFGVIWAFNGEEPLFELPSFRHPDDELEIGVIAGDTYNCDGWVFACNTPDMQHLKVVHKIMPHHADPHKDVEWDPWGFHYNVAAAHGQGPEIGWRLAIRGTSIFHQQGMIDDWWFGVIAGFSCPRPGKHQIFLACATHRGSGSVADVALAKERLERGMIIIRRTADEDRDILNTIHYRPGTLTKGDTTLAKYLDFLRGYPRAHPSARFIV